MAPSRKAYEQGVMHRSPGSGDSSTSHRVLSAAGVLGVIGAVAIVTLLADVRLLSNVPAFASVYSRAVGLVSVDGSSVGSSSGMAPHFGSEGFSDGTPEVGDRGRVIDSGSSHPENPTGPPFRGHSVGEGADAPHNATKNWIIPSPPPIVFDGRLVHYGNLSVRRWECGAVDPPPKGVIYNRCVWCGA